MLDPRLEPLLRQAPDLGPRLQRLRAFGRKVRPSEYHLTNACNLRCKGCWFFALDFDDQTKEQHDLDRWRGFAARERAKGRTTALLIGGEPTLFLDRITAFVEAMPFVGISTNGLRVLPKVGFEGVNVAVTLFGGGPLDDEIRGIRPNGKTFGGLFDTSLGLYENDPRTIFIFGLTGGGLAHIEPTVRRIRDNGNIVTFNYYRDYSPGDAHAIADEVVLLDEALRVQAAYPETVVCHPAYIRALLTGSTHFGEFGYASCPSISWDHPDHAERIANGEPVLKGFNAYAADTETVHFCCTSGQCATCRDSQAIYSWLLVSLPHYLRDVPSLRTWIEIAESYWKQFVWSPWHRARGRPT